MPETNQTNSEDSENPDQAFFDKTLHAIEDLFERAKTRNEIHFAWALNPEVRGSQDAGWSTAHEAIRTFKDFSDLIPRLPDNSPIKVRVALAFYNHLAEGSGFYEIPKKMLLTIEGNGNNIMPFSSLVRPNARTGYMIAPNANRIMADLIDKSDELGLTELVEVIRDSFDPDVRNAVAHADYIIWQDGLRLRRRNGGQPRVIAWDEFHIILNRGINFFHILQQVVHNHVTSYHPAKIVRGRLNDNEPEDNWSIKFDPADRTFTISTGGIPNSG